VTPRVAIGEPLRTATSVRVELGGRLALRDASLTVHRGEIVALLGRNGAGKTTLLRALGGLVHPKKGRVTGSTVGYVPQDPSLLFTADSVRAELETTLRLLGRRDHEVVDEWLDTLHLTALADRHPRSLSGGERQRVAIAAVGVGRPDVLLLDEPTRGIDAPSRDALVAALDAIAAEGRAVVLATHDVDLAARVATSVTVLGDGEVVAQGDARDVLAGSLFAPAVMRVLPPFLTVEEVAAAIAAAL
jgi:energy-coupling factor transport system ATP-binding protein